MCMSWGRAGPGWVVVVNLLQPEIRESIGCKQAEAREILRLMTQHRETLLAAWHGIHG